MIEPGSQVTLRKAIDARVADDAALLKQLRDEIRPIKSGVRRIQPRTTTAISLVGTDGGNNSIPFDPFLIQIIRVVDSSNNEYCLEAITPTTNVRQLSALQFEADGATPRTPLGDLMLYLGVNDLRGLSHMIRDNPIGAPVSPGWVQVYRELVEWAILFAIVRHKEFATDTVLVFDGLLRSKVFARDLFARYLAGLQEGIDRHLTRSKRHLYLVGIAKHSQVLTRYRLAMALEQILTTDYPAYVEIPRDIEVKAYLWDEYARGSDVELEGREVNTLAGGKMFFAKFGSRPRDPIWPVDIFLPQRARAPAILGFLLADALNGFPVPCYPLCLQRAHEHAALVDFDFDILQDEVFAALRHMLGNEAPALDAFRLMEADPSQRRYT